MSPTRNINMRTDVLNHKINTFVQRTFKDLQTEWWTHFYKDSNDCFQMYVSV